MPHSKHGHLRVPSREDLDGAIRQGKVKLLLMA